MASHERDSNISIAHFPNPYATRIMDLLFCQEIDSFQQGWHPMSTVHQPDYLRCLMRVHPGRCHIQRPFATSPENLHTCRVSVLRFRNTDDEDLPRKGLKEMLTKARLISEHRVTVNEHLVRRSVELLKEPENAGKLTPVELSRHVRRNCTCQSNKFRDGFCVCIVAEEHGRGRCTFIPNVVGIKSRDHYSPSLKVQRQYKAGHSPLS
jgi:hypothetical protein